VNDSIFSAWKISKEVAKMRFGLRNKGALKADYLTKEGINDRMNGVAW